MECLLEDSDRPQLIVVAGPTAVGKTQYCIELAKKFNTEIVSADSRQCYQELVIGVARPSRNELQAIPHHFIASHSIHDPLTAAAFEQQALQLLGQLFSKHKRVICTGGSGLYIRALVDGLDPIPDVPSHIEDKLLRDAEEKGLHYLVEQLSTVDPDIIGQIDVANSRRVIRALTVFHATGRPLTSYWESAESSRPFDIYRFVLLRERAVLYDRINRRVDLMVAQGLIEEARALYPYRHLKALQTVGYQELFDHFDQKLTLEEAITLIKRNSRHYAKRQLTWFRNQGDWQEVWLD